MREQQSLFGANVVLIKDKASGTQLIQELIQDGCYAVTRYQPLGACVAVSLNHLRLIPLGQPSIEAVITPSRRSEPQYDAASVLLQRH